MDKANIAISTITLARDEREENLLRKSLQVLAQLEIPVFVSDGGSAAGFLDFLNSFPHFTIVKPQAKGVWPQAKSSVQAAYSNSFPYIFYTEPDKYDFFRNALPGFLTNAFSERTGIILASRSQTAFSTFPVFQQTTEKTINDCCFEIIGKQFEYTYGPFLLNSRLVPYLEFIKEDVGWGWRPYIFSMATRLGFEVESLTGNFCCPQEQREDSQAERIYRMRQLTQNIQGLVHSTTINDFEINKLK